MKQLLRRFLFAPLHPFALRPLLALARQFRFLPGATFSAANPPRRVLVANLTTYLGDGVMMMPFLWRLHRALPSATIELATTSAITPLFRPLTWLSAVHALPAAPSTVPVWSTYRRMLQMLQLARALPPDTGFDLCLLPRWGTDPGLSAWFALFAGVPQVYGYDAAEETYGHTTVPGEQHILTRAFGGGLDQPEAMRELRLLEVSGLTAAMDYEVERRRIVHPLRDIRDSMDVPVLKQRMGLADLPDFVAMAPGASSVARRWPTQRFAELADLLFRETGRKSVLLGGPAEASLGQSIQNAAPEAVLNCVGQTSLPETVALLAEAVLLVANDSGPSHLGGGVGTPTIVLSACPSGSTQEHAGSPARVAPVGPSVHVLQPASAGEQCRELCCSKEAHCILGLSTSLVAEHALQLLDGSRRT